MNKNNPQTLEHKVAMLRHRHFLLSADFLICFTILILGSLLFILTDLDMQIQRSFYKADSGWFLAKQWLFDFLYHYGNIPALLISSGGLLAFILSYYKKSFVKWRKVAAFLVLVMALGPGLIVNSLLKDQWGRPRPRNIAEFGGKHAFERLLTIDPQSDGKSFPCGHATVGFYLFVPWFVLRKHKRIYALGSLTLGLIAGLAIGLARIAQGGHFASDVLWAGVIVYLVAFGLYRLLKLDRHLYYEGELKLRQKRFTGVSLLWLLLPMIIFMLLLATPYQRDQSIVPYQDKIFVYDISLERSQLELSFADSTVIRHNSQGFGFPGSKLKLHSRWDEANGIMRLFEKRKGVFTELSATCSAVLDSLTQGLSLRMGDANTLIDLRKASQLENLTCEQEAGVLTIYLSETSFIPIFAVGQTLVSAFPKEVNVQRLNVMPSTYHRGIYIKMQRGEVIIK